MGALRLKNYQNFMIFFTFFFFWFSIQFGEVVEDSVAYILVVSIGIFHGANDLLILAKNETSKKDKRNNILSYLGIIILCVIIYLLVPFLAILLFIILSSYHFGEEHFSEEINVNRYFNMFYFLVYGFLIFSMLFNESKLDVDLIMLELTSTTFTEFQIKVALLTSLTFLALMSLYLYLKKKKTILFFGQELFYLGLLFLVFKTSSLILSFAIYFILWHSIPSIIHQIEYISGSLNRKNIFYYIKKGLLNWAISIIGLCVIYYFFPQLNVFASIVFMILFAVTAPHAWVMYNIKK